MCRSAARLRLSTVKLKALNKPKVSFHKSCGKRGDATGKIIGLMPDQVLYALHAPRTGPHWHWRVRAKPTYVPEGTNRSATLSLQPTFIASGSGVSETVAFREERRSAARDDVVEVLAELSSPWGIEIHCVYNNDAQEATSRVGLTPRAAQQSGDRFDAGYDGHTLRISTH
jgi:hypothetical protein